MCSSQSERKKIMTHKEIAQRLDAMLEHKVGSFQLGEELIKLRDELDPPRPKPGTVVWWKWDDKVDWRIGEVAEDGKGIVARVFSWADHVAPWDRIEWKPARILGPEQVAVDVPPVSGWPVWAEAMAWSFISPVTYRDNPFVTRDEAERLEEKHD